MRGKREKPMKLLFWQWNSFCGRGIEKALNVLGLDYDAVYYHPSSFERDEKLRKLLDKALSKGYDALFSVNFSTDAAQMCEKHCCLYYSWIYDCPVNIRDREPMKADHCRLFFFDSVQAQKAVLMGMNASYLPLAADSSVFYSSASKGKAGKYDVSMVGSLYRSEYKNYLKPLDDYHRGFLESIVRCQADLPFGFMIPDVVTDGMVNELNGYYRRAAGKNAEVSIRELVYLLSCEVTGRARVAALSLLSNHFRTGLWSGDTDDRIPKTEINPYIDYYSGMPSVFASSKVNLNVSLCAIESGIPLRVLDIIACGGFVLSDWKADMEEFFVPGDSIEIFTSLEELYTKTAFYIKNEKKRERIVRKSREVLEKAFRFEDRLRVILSSS